MSDDETTILKHVIDPDQPDAHRFTDKAEIFFQDEFEEALVSICEHIARLEDVRKSGLENPGPVGLLPKEEENLIHRHSTIGIFGQRGVGKTSFLLTIKDVFDDNDSNGDGLLSSFNLDLDVDDKPEDLKDKVWTLDSIDPSRIEKEDKLLVTITSKILDHVRENNDGDLSKNRAVQDALEDLSRRFRVLFSDATDELLKEAASDPLRFAGEVLFDADSGPKLAKAFHRFLALAAEDLGVRCFMLPIDDVDTSFDKGWPLLETLRKYLATDRLITVVSGDLEFFDLLVQQEAHERTETYRKAEMDYLSAEFGSDENLRRKFDAIRRFPGQYLQKVFPVNDRLRIPDIHSVVLDPNIDLKLITKSGGVVLLGPSVLVISRLLFGTAYIPNKNDGKVIIFQENNDGSENENRVSRLSSFVGPNAIDSLIPTNTRRFIAFVESIPEPLKNLVERTKIAPNIAEKFRKQIAENHSSLLRTFGLEIEDISRLAKGRGFANLSRAFRRAQVGSIDLVRLQADLFRDHPSYDRWRALLSLTASALYADWSSTLTGLTRYAVKVMDTLAVAEEIGSTPGTLDTSLNEPSWKSRCRLLRTELSDQWKLNPDALGTALRIPRKKVNDYKAVLVQIAPGSSISPDYLRWWRSVSEVKDNDQKAFGAKNRAVMSEYTYRDSVESHAMAIHGLELPPISVPG